MTSSTNLHAQVDKDKGLLDKIPFERVLTRAKGPHALHPAKQVSAKTLGMPGSQNPSSQKGFVSVQKGGLGN